MSETEQHAASHPPAFVSTIVKTLLRSPLHGMMSKNMLLLSFKGRKSGKTYNIPIIYAQEGQKLTCFTPASWWKNLRGGATVTVVLKGRKYQGLGTAIKDDQELIVREHYAFLQKQPDVAKYRSVGLNAQKQPVYEDVVRASQDFALIQIQL